MLSGFVEPILPIAIVLLSVCNNIEIEVLLSAALV